MERFIAIVLFAFGCAVFYSAATVSGHADKYISDADSVTAQTGAPNVIVVDFTKSSCSDRLVIFRNGRPVYSGAVLHGNGKGNTPRTPKFSNESGSKCSCLGLFKVTGTRTMSNGYPCMTLQGLDSTNSNAQSRGILVHPSILVSLLPFEVEGACFPLTDASNGCFAVSFHTFKVIEKLQKPIYIYAKYNN